MIFRDVVTVLGKELRETLRDRRTLMVMVLFPLVVYPLVSLLLAETMAGKEAADEARVSEVAVTGGAPADAAAVCARLTRAKSAITCAVRPVGASAGAAGAGAGAAALAADLAAARVDAYVELSPPPAARAAGPIAARIVFDETRERSEKARARIDSSLVAALPPACAPSYAVTSSSTAPRTKVGGYVLSKILPLIVVVMTMLGAFYPAVDITAGERERGTLETLLASPVRRFDLMAGKVLAVTVLAALTGMLNIVSMSLTVAESARLAAGSPVLAIPWTRAAATVLIVVPAAFLFGAVMVAIGALARSFKEAQNLLAPVYLLCITPSLVASFADFRLAGPIALVPGTNLTLLARDLVLGDATVGAALVVLASTIAFGALALAFAARLYDSERLLAATDADLTSIGSWLRHLVGRAPRPGAAAGPRAAPIDPTAGHAIAIYGVVFVLWFFVFIQLQTWRLIPGLLLSQGLGFLGVVWVYARLVRRPLADVLVFQRPRGWAIAGAVMLGLSGWVILGVLTDKLMPPPRDLVEKMRELIRPSDASRPLGVTLLALALAPAVCEEALFRGPILRGLRARFPAPAAALLTGILFGILHGDVWRFVPTTLLGTLLSWVALTSGSIVPAMLLHFLNNAALVLLGTYGLDEWGEHLAPKAAVALLAAAVAVFAGGIAAVRRGQK